MFQKSEGRGFFIIQVSICYFGKMSISGKEIGAHAGATPPPPCYVPKTSTRPNFSAFVRNIWDSIASLLSVRSYDYISVQRRSNAVLGQEHMLLDLRGLNNLYRHYPVPYTPLSYDKEISISFLPSKHKTTHIGIKMTMFTIYLLSMSVFRQRHK